MADAKKLVIVESPAKAKTIGQYLGDGFEVLASVGHVRDLIEPKNLPADLKKGSLGKFSIDIEHDFEPYYVVSPEKKKTVTELKRALKNADELYLATDGDREGEAIAWHLLQVLKPKVPVHRMVFNEITKDAIRNAAQHTRQLDDSLVDAQETRRILDRLYGYEISPVLWRKVGPGLSAGRVQSAATRLIVDRERQRMAFTSAQYWDVIATVAPAAGGESFETKLQTVNGAKIATGRDFSDDGKLTSKRVVLVDKPLASRIAQALNAPDAQLVTERIDAKPYRRSPAAPFTTSTLQQEASRKLRFTARQTMSLAQRLYENGHITYMRTDSSTLSDQAVTAARSQAVSLYGESSIPAQPRRYKGSAKNAQEAHEAIRPAGAEFRLPKTLQGTLSDAELKLYRLIWRRTVASQMIDATGSTVTLQMGLGPLDDGTTASFTASGTVIAVRGFLEAYDEDREQTAQQEHRLPQLKEGQVLSVDSAEAKHHDTTPPARYTEASLVKELESLGIGRPSTYAAIISTIQDRGYVRVKGQALVPNWIAFSVVRLLEEHFANLVDYAFTAKMEDDLDEIAAGHEARVDWLHDFYFGHDDREGLRSVVENLGEIDARAINSTKLTDNITLRIGKYGPYLEVNGDSDEPRRVNIPEELEPDELTVDKAKELVDAPVIGDRVLGVNPDTGHDVVVKDGRFGPYVTEVLPEGESWPKGQKAPTASLFRSQSPDTIVLADALQLLSLPREVGPNPETGEVITAQNGRYGPYLKQGSDTRKLPSEESILTIDVPGALALFAQPKYGNRAAATALKEFGEDPTSGKPIKIKDGRFGPYVTDGTTNATVPRGEDPAEVTFDRAVELLEIKRAKGPSKRTTKRKSTAKKTTAKKTTAKKLTTKKTTTKKSTAKSAKPKQTSTSSRSTASK